MVDVHFGSSHHFVHALSKELDHCQDHRLALQFIILEESFRLLISIKRRKGIIVDEGDEQTKSRKGDFVVLFHHSHHDVD